MMWILFRPSGLQRSHPHEAVNKQDCSSRVIPEDIDRTRWLTVVFVHDRQQPEPTFSNTTTVFRQWQLGQGRHWKFSFPIENSVHCFLSSNIGGEHGQV